MDCRPEGHAGARGCDAAARGGNPDSLKEYVQICFLRSVHSLWSTLDDDERRLRRRCLRDRLCRQAQEKYWPVVSRGYAGSWSTFLHTPQGRTRIKQWVERKVSEVEGKRAGRSNAV
uniref:Uncharacterized protein n=1 Tax=Alexandrium andersonii TaxID=327968 RepID=A0A7S2IPQ0_9DINO